MIAYNLLCKSKSSQHHADGIINFAGVKQARQYDYDIRPSFYCFASY